MVGHFSDLSSSLHLLRASHSSHAVRLLKPSSLNAFRNRMCSVWSSNRMVVVTFSVAFGFAVFADFLAMSQT